MQVSSITYTCIHIKFLDVNDRTIIVCGALRHQWPVYALSGLRTVKWKAHKLLCCLSFEHTWPSPPMLIITSRSLGMCAIEPASGDVRPVETPKSTRRCFEPLWRNKGNLSRLRGLYDKDPCVCCRGVSSLEIFHHLSA